MWPPTVAWRFIPARTDILTTVTTVSISAFVQEEAAMGERRQELFILFRNTAKVAPSQACTYLATRLQAAFTASSSVQVCKAALSVMA